MDTRRALLLTGGAVILAGVGTYFYQQYSLAKQLCYGADNYRLIKAGLNRSVIGADLIVENKGELKLQVNKIIMDVYANDVFLAKITEDKKFMISPRQKISVPFTVEFSPAKVLQSVGQIFAGSGSLDSMRLRFKGRAYITKFGLPIGIPFDFSYTVAQLRGVAETTTC